MRKNHAGFLNREVLGYLDDLVLVPLGIILVKRMIPPVVLQECREQAQTATSQSTPKSWMAAVVIVALWILLGIFAAIWIGKLLRM